MSRASHMQGQSTVEFAAGAATLVLLLTGTLVLSGFQEAQRRTLSAARHAAFLQMWGERNDEALAARLHALHFDDPGYTRPAGSQRWIGRGSVAAATQGSAVQGVAGTAASALLRPLQLSSGFLNADFDLSPGGYQSARVTVQLRPSVRLPAPFDALDLSVSHAVSLLGDAWNASGSRQVRQRTAGLVPTSALAGFSSLWQGIAAPLSLLEPNLDRLCPGLIEPEGVPEDRLGQGVVRAEVGTCH
ncbi:MAG: hypothetical protein QM696_03735 [Steroidobacteraceae bacterium]